MGEDIQLKNMNRILCTGSSGFIGSHLMKKLDAVGYDLKSGQDIRDTEQLRSYLKGIDIVVHLAANTSVKQAWDNPTDLYNTNIIGTSNVIEECIRAKVKKIVFASSASVERPFANPYSFSKKTCEGLFETRKDEIDCIALRFMNVYGKGQNPNYGTVIPAFYNGIKKGEIDIYGDGSYTRDFIWVDDIVTAIKKAIDYKHNNTHKFTSIEIGTGIPTSVNQLAKKMSKLLGKEPKINHLPFRKEVKDSVAVPGIALMTLGFKTTTTIDEGLKKLIETGI